VRSTPEPANYLDHIWQGYCAYTFDSSSLSLQNNLELRKPHNLAIQSRDKPMIDISPIYTPQSAFNKYTMPVLHSIFSPIFFASIGSALPIRSLGFANGSNAVVWRGILYSLLVVIAKFIVGLWVIIWPESGCVCWKAWRRKQPRSVWGGEDYPNDNDIHRTLPPLNPGRGLELQLHVYWTQILRVITKFKL